MKLFRSIFVLIMFTIPALSVTADDLIEWVSANGGVNWSTGQITAEGAGLGPQGVPPAAAKLMACRAAVVEGQRNLLEAIQGVRVNSLTIVSDMMLEKDVIKTTVSGLIQGATVVKRTPNDDGTCVVQMVAPLNGKFATIIYDQEINQDSTAPTTAENSDTITGNSRSGMTVYLNSLMSWFTTVVDASLDTMVPNSYASSSTTNDISPAPRWQEAMDKLNQRLSALEELISTHPAAAQEKDAKATGLVLDARGSNFIPSMSPKIRKIRAGVLYPNRQHQVNARDRGQLVSLFTRDLDTARRHPIVGDRPVVIKALRTWGDTRTEIVLGKKSSAQLELLIKDGFLEDAGVIIVL